jgi:hypothetical protein
VEPVQRGHHQIELVVQDVDERRPHDGYLGPELRPQDGHLRLRLDAELGLSAFISVRSSDISLRSSVRTWDIPAGSSVFNVDISPLSRRSESPTIFATASTMFSSILEAFSRL